MTFKTRLLTTLAILMLPAASFAQSALDRSAQAAEEAAKRAEARAEAANPKQSGAPVLSGEAGEAVLPPAGGPKVVIRSVTLSPPSAFFTPAEVASLTQSHIGKAYDFRGISTIVKAVNDLYKARGIPTAAAILPPQDLSTGALMIRLVEGELGNVALVGERETKTEFVLERVTLARDKTVDVPQISKDVDYFNQTNRAKLRVLLRPGAAFGLTDLSFGISEPAKNELSFYLDNTGVSTTGKTKVGALYRRYGLAGMDDTFLLFSEISQGARSLVVSYDVPVTPSSTRLNFGANVSEIRIVSGPTEPLQVTGSSASATVGVTQPFLVADGWKLEGKATFFMGHSNSKSAGAYLVNTQTRKTSVGLSFDYTAARGRVGGQLNAIRASVENRMTSSFRDVELATGTLYANYAISDTLSFIGSGGFQWADQRLLPGNLLYQIGGFETVRGYPSEGVAGDRGYRLSLELHQALPTTEQAATLFGFADYGKVFSTFPANTEQSSVGFGLNIGVTDTSSFSLTAARPLRNAVPDQDDYVIYLGYQIDAF